MTIRELADTHNVSALYVWGLLFERGHPFVSTHDVLIESIGREVENQLRAEYDRAAQARFAAGSMQTNQDETVLDAIRRVLGEVEAVLLKTAADDGLVAHRWDLMTGATQGSSQGPSTSGQVNIWLRPRYTTPKLNQLGELERERVSRPLTREGSLPEGYVLPRDPKHASDPLDLIEAVRSATINGERISAWKAVNAAIPRGDLDGHGLDKQAERNGMIMATNILFERLTLDSGAETITRELQAKLAEEIKNKRAAAVERTTAKNMEMRLNEDWLQRIALAYSNIPFLEYTSGSAMTHKGIFETAVNAMIDFTATHRPVWCNGHGRPHLWMASNHGKDRAFGFETECTEHPERRSPKNRGLKARTTN